MREEVQQVDVITNNFFSCRETPIKITDADMATIQDLGECGNCKVRLTTLIAGSGNVTVTPQGLAFEVPQATLEFNGLRHSCIGALLSIPAMHNIDLRYEPYVMPYNDMSGAEVHVKFRGETAATRNSYYTLVLPVKVTFSDSTSIGETFFAALGTLQRTRPTLGSIIRPDTPMILYKGTDLEGRVEGDLDMCKNTVGRVSYLVALRPINMRKADWNRFYRILKANTTVYKTGPPRASTPITNLKLPLISYINSITVIATSKSVKNGAAVSDSKQIRDGYVETSQVKCRPLNMSRDIEGDRIYVGGPGPNRSLKDELQDAADMSKGLDDSEGGTDVSRIETILGIILGVLLGLFLISLIAYFVFKNSTSLYLKVSAIWSLAKLKDVTGVKQAITSQKETEKATKATKT